MNEFSIAMLIGILRKCVIYMLLAVIVFAVGAYCYCSFIATPTYQSSISFISTNGGDSIAAAGDTTSSSYMSNADIVASRNMLSTYVDIFKTLDFYEQVQADTGLDYTPSQLKSMVTVQERSDQSLFIDITVTSPSTKHSVLIAESIYKIGSEYVVKLMPKAYVKAVEDTDNRAVQNYPNTPITIVIAAFLGAVLVFVIAVIINMMDKTIKGEEDFSNHYDIPILGNIPNFKAAAREEKK